MGKDVAVWTEGIIEKYVDLCIKEIQNNNRPHTHFSQKGWENLEANFAKETGKIYSRKQLKNKWDGLKGDWKLWKDLKGRETGLGWDPVLQTIDASDEWWNEKLQGPRGKDYGKLRKKGLSPDFEAKLDMMFMSIAATGSNAYSPSSSLPIPSEHESVLQVDIEEGSGDSDEVLEQQTSKRKRREAVERGMGLPQKKEKIGGSAYLGKQLNRIVEVLESTSTAIKSRRARTVTPTPTPPPTCLSMEEVMDIVKQLPGMVVGSHMFMFTTQMFQQPAKREMFGALKDEMLQLEFIKFEYAMWK